MEYAYAAAAGGPALRKAVIEWGKRAIDLGCDTRGFVEVEPGLWASRRGGTTELLHRKPTDAESRAAIGHPAPTGPTAPRVERQSPAARRMTKMFGDAR